VIAFWVIAAALVTAAVLFVVPALVRRPGASSADTAAQNVALAQARLAELQADAAAGRLEPDQLEALRTELEENLASELATSARAAGRAAAQASPWPAVAVALALPALAGTFYLLLGNPRAIETPVAQSAPAGHPAGAGADPASIEQMAERLVAKLATEPDNAEGWFMLGNTYMALRRYEDAAKALSRARELVGDDARVLLRYADAKAMAAGGRLSGEPFEIVRSVLAREPENPTALWLAGMGYSEGGDDASALAAWEKLLPMLGDEPESANEVRALINTARQRLGKPPLAAAAAPAAAPATPAAAGPASLEVSVRLDPALASRLQADDTVFVYARALSGPPMPLAAVRRRAAELPLTVTLSDAQAMAPGLNLSSAREVRIGARVSHTGNAISQPGDLRGEVAPVKVDAGRVEVVISEVVR